MSGDALDSTATRWCDRETGERLVAVATKLVDGGPRRLVLPVEWWRKETHVLDWMPETMFFARYESVEVA